jgi:hypothetical protein
MRLLHPRQFASRGARLAAGFSLVALLAAPVGPAAAQPLISPISPPTISTTQAATGPFCSIQFNLANPSPGDENVPRSLMMSGTAFDKTATSGNGISQIQAFLGNRNEGGLFIGQASFSTMSPDNWTLSTSMPEGVSGGQNLFVYALSSVSGEQAVIEVPIVVGGEAPEAFAPSTSATVSCPSIVRAPTTPPIASAGGGA